MKKMKKNEENEDEEDEENEKTFAGATKTDMAYRWIISGVILYNLKELRN